MGAATERDTVTDAPETTAVVQYAPAAAPPRGLSIASMVIGIASILFGWMLLAPVAGVVLGILGLRREPEGRPFAIAGIVLGGLALVGWLLVVLAFIGVIVGFLGLAASAGHYSQY